jgi:SOS response regulatory protein OraA/RecX
LRRSVRTPKPGRPSPSRADCAFRLVTDDAVELALRALRHRDRSASEVDRHLEARGVEEAERRSALATLVRTGLVDDRRYSESRAASLAARGAGDSLIRHELCREGVESELVEGALAALPSERERAELIVCRRGAATKTARYLVRKGFAEDVVQAVVAKRHDEALG